MDTKTLICILSICIGTDGSMQPDEVNKLKEIIKNLTSIKLNFTEIRQEMDRFSGNGRKNEPLPKISEIVKFQIGRARQEFQFHLDDGVLNTNKGLKDAKQRIRNKFDRSMNYTKVNAHIVNIYIALNAKSYETLNKLEPPIHPLCSRFIFVTKCISE